MNSLDPQLPARYAVVFRAGPEAPVAGALVVDDERLLLEGRSADGPVELSVPYAELVEVRIGRSLGERLKGRLALLLERVDGPAVQVEPLAATLLHELFDLLRVLAADHADAEEVAVSVPLKKGRLAEAKALVAQGPPFEPAALGLTSHQVFLTAEEAIFVFAGPHVRATLERATHDPTLWRLGFAWRGCIGGRPRLTALPGTRRRLPQPVYSWNAGVTGRADR